MNNQPDNYTNTKLCTQAINTTTITITNNGQMDSLRGSSVTIGTLQIILAWPVRKDVPH